MATIAVSFVLGWIVYNVSPVVWTLPERLMNIPSMSPEAVLQEVREHEAVNLWRNTLLRCVLTGTAIGLCGLILHFPRVGRDGMRILVPLLSGVIFGALMSIVGIALRGHFDRGAPIPTISDDMRPLFTDIVVFALSSIFLSAPLAVLLALQSERPVRQKAAVVPLAGILTGLVVPIVTAFALSHLTTTDVFPPDKRDLTILWFATLAALTALLVVYSGDRKPRS